MRDAVTIREHLVKKCPAIDLGLELLSIFRAPGDGLTQRDIAAWCGCTPQLIKQIERRALKKARVRLAALTNGETEEAA